ncbi:MAG: hypothetical protein OSA11_00615 [Candidatus Nanopelagicales bacterium]|nr:hypothetical protein [Candidatus Nanopelagicales bacterium]
MHQSPSQESDEKERVKLGRHESVAFNIAGKASVMTHAYADEFRREVDEIVEQ